MPLYRLLYFSGPKLERSELLEAKTSLSAIEEAARRPSHDLVELWSDAGRLATFRPARRHVPE